MSASVQIRTILVVRGGDINKAPHILALVNYLVRNAHVTFATWGTESRPPTLDPKVHLVKLDGLGSAKRGRRAFSIVSRAIRLAGLVRNSQFDLIYVIDSWTAPYVMAARTMAFSSRRTTLAYHTFEWLDPAETSFIRRAMERHMCRLAALVLSNERTRGRLLQSLYRLKAHPLCVRNSMLADTPLPSLDHKIRRFLMGGASAEGGILMAYPSTPSPERLTLELIESFALLPDEYYLFTLQGKTPYFARCLQRVEELGLTGRIRFVPATAHSELSRYVGCADIGAIFHDHRLSCGNFLSAPQRVADYSAAGVPFVASNYPNMEALVYKYRIGVCCDATDPRDIARAIRELPTDPGVLRTMRQHVRRVFEQYLCFDTDGPALMSAIDQVLVK